MIKSYRGKIEHADIQTINLHTNNGLTGYKIVKFELMGVAPAAQANESIVKIYTTPRLTATGTIDFNDQDLIAAGFIVENSDSRYLNTPTIVFDNEVFNQDIYITYFDQDGNNGACNYYIELEQMPLSEDQALVSIVKNLRNEKYPDNV